jgi:hypothetical protein
MHNRLVSASLVLTMALLTTAASAQDQASRAKIDLATPEPSPAAESSKPREFALGLALLKEHGFGVIGRVRFNHVALDAAYGVMPLFILWQTADGTTMHVDADLSFVHVGAGPVFFFNDHLDRFQNGLRLAGIYDQVLGPGGGLGWVGEITKRSFAIALGAGLQYYPDAGDRVRRHFHYSPGSDVSAAALQIYFGLNLLWYLG